MSLEVNTGRNNNRDVTWLVNDNSIEMPLSPSGTESVTSSDNTSDTSSSYETSTDNSILEGYVPPTPLSENEVINPYLVGSIQNVLNNCNTSVIPFRDSTNNIVGTVAEELQNFDFDCPICLEPLEASDVITMDCHILHHLGYGSSPLLCCWGASQNDTILLNHNIHIYV